MSRKIQLPQEVVEKIRLFVQENKSDQEIGEIIGRSASTIKKYRLRFQLRKINHWNHSELDQLTRLFHQGHNDQEIGKILGRSYQSIKLKRHELKLTRKRMIYYQGRYHHLMTKMRQKILEILNHGPMTLVELSRRCGLSRNNTYKHLKRAQKLGRIVYLSTRDQKKFGGSVLVASTDWLIQQHQGLIWRACNRVKIRSLEPEEIYQEAILIIYRLSRMYRPGKKASWPTWIENYLGYHLLQVIRDMISCGIRNSYRKEIPFIVQRFSELEDEETRTEKFAVTEDCQEQQLESRIIWEKAKKLLTPRQWNIVRLAVSGYNFGEIARQCQISKQRVNQIYSQSMIRMKSYFGILPSKRFSTHSA